ncbi:hypothetical protein I6B53_08280 [Schaalia sp. 19OD2882]|uniref:hypothetical protein n=1 Tax=Schaalia sp. 19OD2882 TaxID=2794089 RepID=UPI001C1EE986|nr:hypothetical protein [Schaalia sp. 19OD2882]QWW19111.1 hypothetical protein I6B53_08280 [Schaalia sp. 19OD2882]
MSRSYVTRREYDEWVRGAASLARALRYPVTEAMVNDSVGIVFGDDQYDAFEKGLWEPTAYEVMIIFEAINQAAVDGLPAGAAPYSEYSGLCDKLMILHPGKYCASHYHLRKTECYEVVMGSMDVFYGPTTLNPRQEELLEFEAMPIGSPWPEGVELPAGREESYADLTSYVRLEAGDPKFVMHRKHLHAFRCPPDSPVPLVVREVSTYSHEPTEAAHDKPVPLETWSGLHDNTFLAPEANAGRLVTKIV